MNEEDNVTLCEAARSLGVSNGLVRKWLENGRLNGEKLHQWSIPSAEIDVLSQRRDAMKSWPRLVDVCRDLGIHRNLGESLCRRSDIAVEKDFSDDYRIPPEAVTHLKGCVIDQDKRKGWILLQDFANELGLPPNVVDGGMRKLNLEFAHNFSGQVIFPDSTRDELLNWRERIADRRRPVLRHNGEELFKLRCTAERSGTFFAADGTPEHSAKVEALCARYRFWIQRGLQSTRMGRTHYFNQATHDLLLDEISTSEASNLAGVAKTTIKDWARKGWLPCIVIAPTRRSYSRSGLLALLRTRFRDEGKMRKRPVVPVRLLPVVSDLLEELGIENASVFFHILQLAAGASQQDCDVIREGHGMVSRSTWETIENWRQDIAAGRRPHCSGSVEIVAEAEEGAVAALPNVLAFLSGVSKERFESVVGDRFAKSLTPLEVHGICQLISHHKGRLCVYNTNGKFGVGDLLIDPDAYDFGAVQEMINGSAMDVDWVRRGRLRMVHR
ncbi:MAG: hypothetical protein ACI9R3_002453 [Verrucomicrobiales bacterium]|jgi:hypothetical protein